MRTNVSRDCSDGPHSASRQRSHSSIPVNASQGPRWRRGDRPGPVRWRRARRSGLPAVRMGAGVRVPAFVPERAAPRQRRRRRHGPCSAPKRQRCSWRHGCLRLLGQALRRPPRTLSSFLRAMAEAVMKRLRPRLPRSSGRLVGKRTRDERTATLSGTDEMAELPSPPCPPVRIKHTTGDTEAKSHPNPRDRSLGVVE